MHYLRLPVVIVLLLASVSAFATAADGTAIGSFIFGDIRAREIGPASMSGRISALDVCNAEPTIIYVGAANGGVWKSVNGGIYFDAVFDKYTQSIGCITIDQQRPDTVWVGTGETWVRNSVSVGTGLYKSTDAGRNWSLAGLENSERIARIVIDPLDPNVVYVAALGHLWNDNPERGLYKTSDGGRTWDKILYVDDGTGCCDVAINPENPKVVFAAMWQFRRTPYSFNSGGPGSGLYRSSDGGKSWTRLDLGVPEGKLGRIALAVPPSQPDRVYATVETEETALYRSDDGGDSWTRKGTANAVKDRPFYFSLLLVDPQDADRIYKPATTMSVSIDGGETFSPMTGGGGVHPDYHALWIDPGNPRHLVLGTDGGVYISYNRGYDWLHVSTLPLSQFYHVSCDNKKPYNVYGGLQDNGSWTAPSRSPGGIENRDWDNVGYGDGFHVLVSPANDDYLYWEYQGGQLYRSRRSSGDNKEIKPYPAAGDPEYRFNWNTPVATSPSIVERLYIGSQFLHRSTDYGDSWVRLSDDLTTNDPDKQKQNESGGLTIDNTTAENHCTIYSISESPLDPSVVWLGTDDGNVQVTANDGGSWNNVSGNIKGLPAHTWCSHVESGHHDRNAAYVTFDGHRTGDMQTYVYKTTDLGNTWTSLTTDSLRGYAHVMREDLVNPDLLFLGTEFGLFVTIDGGRNWAQFRESLPNVAVMDMVIQPRESDLVFATHGRGMYIIDDLTILRQLKPEILTEKIHPFQTEPAIISTPRYRQEFSGDARYVGSNPDETATIAYYLEKRHMFGDFRAEIYDADGKLIKKLPAGKRKGVNFINWHMRLKAPKVARSKSLAAGALFGPTVPEGTYTYKLMKGSDTLSGEIKVAFDPDNPHSTEDRALQQQTVMKLYGMQEDLGYIAAAIEGVLEQIGKRKENQSAEEELLSSLTALENKLTVLRDTIAMDDERQGISVSERLRERATSLYGSVSGYGGRPSDTQLMRMQLIDGEIADVAQQFQTMTQVDLTGVNDLLSHAGAEPISLLSRDEYDKQQ